MNTGWICPRCGKSNNPTKESCDCAVVRRPPPCTQYDPPVMPGTTPWCPTEGPVVRDPLPHERPQVWCAGQDLEHYSTRGAA